MCAGVATILPALAYSVTILATIRIAGLDESSGLAASRRHPGVFWTMNDDGGPFLYAFNRLGESQGRVRIAGARNSDWEGLAIGPGPVAGIPYLYIGDIGDNLARREFISVYRVQEPALGAKESGKSSEFRFTYPGGPQDAEALLVHPVSGDLYIINKTRGTTNVFVARAPLKSSVLKHVADLDLPGARLLTLLTGRVTDGSISPDGSRVVLCDYARGFEAVLPRGRPFDEIWTSKWTPIDLGDREQGEGVAYSLSGKTILATSEGVEFPLIEVNALPAPSVK